MELTEQEKEFLKIMLGYADRLLTLTGCDMYTNYDINILAEKLGIEDYNPYI